MNPLEIEPDLLIDRLPTLLSWEKKTTIAGLIDVRSPGEFEDGQLPGFSNVPILNNSERSQVGTTYKTKGRETAIELGHQLVGPHKDELLQEWIKAISKAPEAIFMCWRGGLRSKTSAQWCGTASANKTIFTVKGGYKGVRNKLLHSLQLPPSLIVLTGLTGSGKTVLIRETPELSIDLEGLAQHRGSAFGRDLRIPQPSQATFENLLGLALRRTKKMALVEDESTRIGDVQLPAQVKEQMKGSPIVILDADLEQRSKRIFDEYVMQPLSNGFTTDALCERYISNIQRIHRKLGGLASSQISQQIQDAFSSSGVDYERHRIWIAALLKDYYDPMYTHALEKQNRKVLFRGDHNECLSYLKTILIRQLSN